MTDDILDLPDTPLPPHPALTKPHRCGVTRMVGRFEFICIKEPHSDPPRPGHGHKSVQIGGDGSPGYYPKSERHMFVRRYPMGDH